jgi:hypothetical protein
MPTIRARVCAESVRIPACSPVNERDGHLLPGREQHVHLALGRRPGDLVRQADEPVRGLAHGGHHDHDAVPRLGGLDDAPGHPPDLLRVGDRRAAVLLDDQAHDRLMRRSCYRNGPRAFKRWRARRTKAMTMPPTLLLSTDELVQ